MAENFRSEGRSNEGANESEEFSEEFYKQKICRLVSHWKKCLANGAMVIINMLVVLNI